MNKVGIRKIGFKEINEVTDQWSQDHQEEQLQEDRGVGDVYLHGGHWFESIDQEGTDLTEDMTIDESGKYYDVQLPFVVRKPEDIALAKKYEGRPVVVYADAVDGKRYTIGTKDYPARLVTSNRYQGTSTREIAMNVDYRSKTSLIR